MKRRRISVFDGILGENIVLSSLMVISPVIICGNTLKNAEALIYAFNSITFLSVLISSFIPRKLPYALKIIIYALISSVVYIPVKMAANEFFPESITRIGIYYPLLAVNSLIVFQSEARLFLMKRGKMVASLFFYILGFDAVMLITGFLRELFAFGTIRGKIVDIDTLISGLSQPFGGFIFLGLMCGVYRRIRASAVRNYNEVRGEADVSDK